MKNSKKTNSASQNTGADKPSEIKEIKHRKLKYGTLATVFTVVFVLAVIIANMLIGYLTDRYVLEIDMTSESLYEISEDTREVLADLDEHITITVLAEESSYKDSTELLAQVYEVLQRYEALAGGKITVQYINPDVNPQIMSKYTELSSPSKNDIIIESSKRYKHLTPTNLYELTTDDSGNTYVVGLRAEQRLTSGIIFVTQETISTALFVKGHGETTSMSKLESILTSGNYEVGTISLATEEIPDNTGVLIISSPTSDYTEDEIAKLDDYLNNGGNAIVAMSSAVTEKLETLERYFEEWGVSYTTAMVFDSAQSLSGYPMYIVPTVASHETITSDISISSTYAVIPGARAMNIMWEESGWRYTTPLMTSSNSSYSKDITSVTTSIEMEPGDNYGPFNVTVLSEQVTADSQLNYTYSRVLFCNTGMIADSVLELDNFMNTKYITSVINYMNDDADAVIIAAKNYSSTTLALTGSQMTTLFWILVIAIPVVILGMGVVVWVRRKHL